MTESKRTVLALKGLLKYLVGVAMVGALLFVSAGDWNYIGAWLMLGLLFIPMFVVGVVLIIVAPEILAKRLNAKEKRKEQSGVVKFSALIFLAGFIIAGVDHRFGWSDVPCSVVAVASVVLLLSYGFYCEVMRENEWLSRTVEVVEGQKVVSSGLYGIVRHPMYTSTILLFLSMQLVLGSWISFAIFLLYLPIIVLRIVDEERLLCTELDGYKEYCQKVRWRLFPYLW